MSFRCKLCQEKAETILRLIAVIRDQNAILEVLRSGNVDLHRIKGIENKMLSYRLKKGIQRKSAVLFFKEKDI